MIATIADPATDVRTLKDRDYISYSAISTYQRCPLKFFFRYVCRHRIGGLGRQRWRHSFEWPEMRRKKGLVRVGVVEDFDAGRGGRESSLGKTAILLAIRRPSVSRGTSQTIHFQFTFSTWRSCSLLTSPSMIANDVPDASRL
jgi:hypothetical protein